MSRIESGLPGLPGGQGLDSIFSTHVLHVLSSLGWSSLGLDSIDCVLLEIEKKIKSSVGFKKKRSETCCLGC